MKTKLMVKTKILSVLLCAVMVLSELPFVALAAASGTDWSLDDDGMLTIESNAGITDGLVASSTNASQVEAVDIQNSVTTIDTGAVNADITADFTDPNFLAAVRNMLGKGGSDPIYAEDVDKVTLLDVNSKGIVSLAGIEHFTALESLYCHNNALTSLAVGDLSNLQILNCFNNRLTELTLNNSAPYNYIDVRNNYMIDTSTAIKGKTIPWDTGNFAFTPQITVTDITADFTDPNFLAAVRNMLGKGGSDPIYAEDVDKVTGLDVNSKSIVSLAGIEHFTALESLTCYNNTLKSLPELPSNLKVLNCYNNALTSLPALPNNLEVLYCNNNALKSLPELPSNLKRLDCNNNELKSLPALPSKLTYLDCYNNELKSLPELPSNLEWLVCNNNELKSLPVLPSNLKMLACNNNELTSLAVGNLSNLQYLYCSNNRLTELTLNNSAPYYGIDVRNNYMKDTSTSITGKTITWDTGNFTFTPQITVPDTQTFPGEWKSDASGNPNQSSPQTGDNSNVLLWAILALLSMSGIAFTIFTKSKRYKE